MYTKLDKAIIAFILAGYSIARLAFGIDIPWLTEEWLQKLVDTVVPLLLASGVYRVANKGYVYTGK